MLYLILLQIFANNATVFEMFECIVYIVSSIHLISLQLTISTDEWKSSVLILDFDKTAPTQGLLTIFFPRLSTISHDLHQWTEAKSEFSCLKEFWEILLFALLQKKVAVFPCLQALC